MMIDRELEGKLAGSWTGVLAFLMLVGRELDKKSGLEGKLAGTHVRGLVGEM